LMVNAETLSAERAQVKKYFIAQSIWNVMSTYSMELNY
jgi:hypothetical protein